LQETKDSNGRPPKKKPDRSKESFEEVPLYTAVMTYLGFYLLMFLGYINQLFFSPKVAMEKNRDVSICECQLFSLVSQTVKKCLEIE
jgi:hypothetical protein